MKKILFLTALSALMLVSCRNSKIEEIAQTGTLQVKLTSLTDFITVESKADGAIDYTDFDNYDVIIDGPTKVNEKFSIFAGRVVELGSGSYTITVTSPYTEPAAFEQPIYQAHDSFEIRAGEVTALDLLCEPYNCKVTIELSDNFKKELATYEVTVNNGLSELVWTKDENKDDFAENKAGYFYTRGLEVKVKGHRAIDDTEATAVYYVKNPQPGEHHILKLDAKVTGNIDGITIDVVTKFNEVENDVNVDGMEETYVDRPDFDGTEDEEDEEQNLNTIVWEGNELFLPKEIDPQTRIQMTITMPAGIEKFVIEVSDNFKGAISEITEGKVEYMDLINDSKICESFADSPLLTGEKIYHQTQIVFDLSTFVPLLCQAASGITVDFILKAEDVNKQPLYIFDSYPVVTLVIPER